MKADFKTYILSYFYLRFRDDAFVLTVLSIFHSRRKKNMWANWGEKIHLRITHMTVWHPNITKILTIYNSYYCCCYYYHFIMISTIFVTKTVSVCVPSIFARNVESNYPNNKNMLPSHITLDYPYLYNMYAIPTVIHIYTTYNYT